MFFKVIILIIILLLLFTDLKEIKYKIKNFFKNK